jgi:hypothetical protein
MRGLSIALGLQAKKCLIRKLVAGSVAVLLCAGLSTQASFAQTSTSTTTTKTTGTASPVGAVTWGGLSWGIGIATDFDVGGRQVANATVINNIVRATDTSSNVGISFVLEAHYFFTDWAVPFLNVGCTSPTTTMTKTTTTTSTGSQTTTTSGYSCNDIGIGPFVAVEIGDGTTSSPSSTGLITSYAMGAMIGVRHPNLAGTNGNSSWNLGVGLRVDPTAKVLGDGLVVNQPLPAGDSIRFKTEPRVGVMLLSSFSF